MRGTTVRSPNRRKPTNKERVSPPSGLDWPTLVQQAIYIGSPEHKTRPFGHFRTGQLRANGASKCPNNLNDPDEITGWLRDALEKGDMGGDWEENYPHLVWVRRGDHRFEGRLVNRVLGQYKGYLLDDDEEPRWL